MNWSARPCAPATSRRWTRRSSKPRGQALQAVLVPFLRALDFGRGSNQFAALARADPLGFGPAVTFSPSQTRQPTSPAIPCPFVRLRIERRKMQRNLPAYCRARGLCRLTSQGTRRTGRGSAPGLITRVDPVRGDIRRMENGGSYAGKQLLRNTTEDGSDSSGSHRQPKTVPRRSAGNTLSGGDVAPPEWILYPLLRSARRGIGRDGAQLRH